MGTNHDNATDAEIAANAELGAMDRASVIARISAALKRRSGKRWSVTGGRGTAYGWLNITAKCAHHNMTDEERTELGKLLGLPPVHHQGHSVPASHDYYREVIERAEGRTPTKIATPYWD